VDFETENFNARAAGVFHFATKFIISRLAVRQCIAGIDPAGKTGWDCLAELN
jgi:hypothetical protein